MRLLVFSPIRGAGKTTVALHLALALADAGRAVALTDLDPSGGLTAAYGAVALAQVDGLPQLTPATETASGDEADFWHILDAAPAWGPELQQQMQAADMILCPVMPEPEAMAALAELSAELSRAGIGADRLGILVTHYSNRLARHRDARAELTRTYGSTQLFPVVIRTSARLAEAAEAGQPLGIFAPRSTAASDFAQLARALIAMHSLSRPKGP